MRLITSIPPRFSRKDPRTGEEVGLAYLARCVESWRRNGFEPVSVNRPDEAETVSTMGLIEVWSADQSEAKLPDKYGPCLGSIFDLLASDEPVAIINADIFMPLHKEISRALAAVLENRIVAARRTDVKSIDDGAEAGSIYPYGYDFFAFKPGNVPRAIKNPAVRSFQLGAPWWDYVFPIYCAAEIPACRLTEPFILHQLHDERWDIPLHQRLAVDACATLADLHECFEPLRSRRDERLADDVSALCHEVLFWPGFYELDLMMGGVRTQVA